MSHCIIPRALDIEWTAPGQVHETKKSEIVFAQTLCTLGALAIIDLMEFAMVLLSDGNGW
jgi:hypothetical protein